MDFHGINTVGKIWLERINSKPVFQANWIGRAIFALDNQTLSIGTSAGWVDIASATQGGITNPSIPIGGTLLFYSDVALAGYTLLTDDDDELVYIGSGSGAGGLPGGAARAGSTWTQPNHQHTSQPHTLTIGQMPAHTHPPQSGFGNFMSTTGSNVGESGDSYGVFSNTGSTGGGNPHTHPNALGNATVAGWRPSGRVWTKQRKN
jgi:hypothetical protein